MMISARECQKHRTKNSRSYGLLFSMASLCSSNRGFATRSMWRLFKSEGDVFVYHLLVIPCAVIICGAVWLGNLLMPRSNCSPIFPM